MDKTEFFVKGNPVGKPRMTQRDKWKSRPCVLHYRAWADTIRYKMKKLEDLPDSNICEISVTFCMPMPETWSERKKELYDLEPHGRKPDVDNLLKGVMDVVSKQDQLIYKCEAIKLWTKDNPGAKIMLEFYEG